MEPNLPLEALAISVAGAFCLGHDLLNQHRAAVSTLTIRWLYQILLDAFSQINSMTL
jgi:hypothetical protein